MTVELREQADGIVLAVRAQAGARTNAVRGEHAGALRVSVTQAAEKGKANAAIARVLCEALKLRGSQVELISGATSQNKQFLVREISAAELAERIAATLVASSRDGRS